MYYGQGEELEKIQDIYASMLLPNITCSFQGFVDNSSLLKEYDEKSYHLFFNVSEAEGIPASRYQA